MKTIESYLLGPVGEETMFLAHDDECAHQGRMTNPLPADCVCIKSKKDKKLYKKSVKNWIKAQEREKPDEEIEQWMTEAVSSNGADEPEIWSDPSFRSTDSIPTIASFTPSELR